MCVYDFFRAFYIHCHVICLTDIEYKLVVSVGEERGRANIGVGGKGLWDYIQIGCETFF